jgi:hypothetical protein
VLGQAAHLTIAREKRASGSMMVVLPLVLTPTRTASPLNPMSTDTHSPQCREFSRERYAFCHLKIAGSVAIFVPVKRLGCRGG